jgi:P27 family predicted phage terminase small subunit
MDRSRNEPKQIKGMPRCPAWLDPRAKAAWKQLLPQLHKMGVLSRIDSNALVRYCRSWSRWIRAEQFIEKHGECYPLKDGNGKTKCLAAFPQVATANKLGMLLTKLEQEFGMTPSARTRIDLPGQALEYDELLDGTPFQRFLAEGRAHDARDRDAST